MSSLCEETSGAALMSERDAAGSKRDPPVGNAEPVRDSGSTFVVVYLRKSTHQKLG